MGVAIACAILLGLYAIGSVAIHAFDLGKETKKIDRE